MSYTKDQMIAIGGKEWTKSDGTVRVYLNRIDNLIGLHIERYKSGNICYAELLGEKISNRKAAQIMASKVYWENGEIYTDVDSQYVEAVMHGIVCEVAEYAE
jgi:hypothetical protein